MIRADVAIPTSCRSRCSSGSCPTTSGPPRTTAITSSSARCSRSTSWGRQARARPPCSRPPRARSTGQRLIGALAGDLATDNDATRLKAAGIRAASITTGSACHLDAAMVHHALHHLPWNDLDYLFIENVGNLVCPAVYDLGQAANVVVLVGHGRGGQAAEVSGDVPQGGPGAHLEDRSAAAPAGDQRGAHRRRRCGRVMPEPHYIAVSARTGRGHRRVGERGCSEQETGRARRRTTHAAPSGHGPCLSR